MKRLGTTGQVVVGVVLASYLSAVVFRLVPGISPEAVAALIPSLSR